MESNAAESIALQEKNTITEALAASAANGPTKLSTATVHELIRIIRALEATMTHHIEVMSRASAAASAVAAAGSTEKTTATTAGAGGWVEDSVDNNRAPTSQRQMLNKSRRSVSRLNGVTSDGLTTTKAVTRSEKVLTTTKAVTRSEKVRVFVRIVFLKLGEIDTIHDCFAADVYIQAKWREPAMDGKRTHGDDIDWDQYWNPKLYIENVYSEAKESLWYTVSYDNLGRATVYEKRRMNGAFFEYMELNQFPFDTQDLTVTLTTSRDEEEIELAEDSNDTCAVNLTSFVDEQEWSLHTNVNTWYKTTVKTSHNVVHRYPGFSAACKASRRPGFFIWNILVVMFFICSLSFATFTVCANYPQFRLQLTFILLLTTVTFKFVVNQSLPRIAYLTYLDKYILTSMSILCCICVWHAIINVVIASFSSRVADLADKVALGVLAFVYVGFHILFVAIIVFVSRSRSSNSEKTNEEAALTLHERNGHINSAIVEDISPIDNNGNGLNGLNGNGNGNLMTDTVWSGAGRRRSVAVASGSARRLSIATPNGHQLTIPGSPSNWTQRGSLARASLSARGSLDSFDE